MHHGVPVPVLQPKGKAGGAGHLGEAIPRSEVQSAVAPTGVDDAGAQDGAHLGQGALVLVADGRGELLPERLDLAAVARVGLLHVDHGRSEEGTLPDKVGHVLQHRLEEGDGLGVTSAGHGNADGDARGIPDVGVETLQQKLDELRNALGGFE